MFLKPIVPLQEDFLYKVEEKYFKQQQIMLPKSNKEKKPKKQESVCFCQNWKQKLYKS